MIRASHTWVIHRDKIFEFTKGWQKETNTLNFLIWGTTKIAALPRLADWTAISEKALSTQELFTLLLNSPQVICANNIIYATILCKKSHKKTGTVNDMKKRVFGLLPFDDFYFYGMSITKSEMLSLSSLSWILALFCMAQTVGDLQTASSKSWVDGEDDIWAL